MTEEGMLHTKMFPGSLKLFLRFKRCHNRGYELPLCIFVAGRSRLPNTAGMCNCRKQTSSSRAVKNGQSGHAQHVRYYIPTVHFHLKVHHHCIGVDRFAASCKASSEGIIFQPRCTCTDLGGLFHTPTRRYTSVDLLCRTLDGVKNLALRCSCAAQGLWAAFGECRLPYRAALWLNISSQES